MLQFSDFKYKKRVRLKNIQVLNRTYFENVRAGELRQHQKSINGQNEFDKIVLTESNASVYSKNSHIAEEAFIQQKMMHEDVAVDVLVTSYAPAVFKYIRVIDQINELDIMKSVRPELNRMQIFKTNSNESHGSGGMSGSFFFFTEDKKYIIKTMTFQEKENLMGMLPNVTKFIMETAGRSLISRVYGVYKVKYPGMNKIYLMI